eukprot:2182100-Rhodomonas_salina.1
MAYATVLQRTALRCSVWCYASCLRDAWYWHAYDATCLQETAVLAQFVLKTRFLVLNFGVYAISGTALAYGATMGLHTCYAMSGTKLAYGATTSVEQDPTTIHPHPHPVRVLVKPYAMPGADIA